MIKVKNLTTGMVHTVPVGHFSITDDGYEVAKEEVKEVAKEEVKEEVKPIEENKRKTKITRG